MLELADGGRQAARAAAAAAQRVRGRRMGSMRHIVGGLGGGRRQSADGTRGGPAEALVAAAARAQPPNSASGRAAARTPLEAGAASGDRSGAGHGRWGVSGVWALIGAGAAHSQAPPAARPARRGRSLARDLRPSSAGWPPCAKRAGDLAGPPRRWDCRARNEACRARPRPRFAPGRCGLRRLARGHRRRRPHGDGPAILGLRCAPSGRPRPPGNAAAARRLASVAAAAPHRTTGTTRRH